MAQPNSDSSNLLYTPLYELSLTAKAKFTEFAGWKMPLQYSGLKLEHQAVRTSVGMFDISHMGKFLVSGRNLLSSLQFLLPSDLSRLQAGQALYSVLLNDHAGIVDDLIFYYQGEDPQGVQNGVIIVNAARTSQDLACFLTHFQGTDVTLLDQSQDLALIALQGAEAINYLNSLVSSDLSTLKPFCHLQTKSLGSLTSKLDQETVFIARTGYTGEDGFEIMLSPTLAQQLWSWLQAQGVTPCGLGARDTLRLEAGMCLYGQELDETTTPLEAGLGWLVHLDSPINFKGRSILEQQKKEGVKRRLVGLEMEGKYIARHGYAVVFEGKIVGEVTSGTLSPTLNKAIALAYVPPSLSKIGQQLQVEIRGKNYPAKVVKKPFYRC